MNRGKEAGHWYRQDGSPCYEVPYAVSNKAKAGQLKPTTLRDAKKLDLVPGATSLGKLLYKYQLEEWIKNEVLMSAATMPHGDLSDSEWIEAVKEESKRKGIETAEKGIEIHGDIEKGIWNDPLIDRNNERRVELVIHELSKFELTRKDIEPEKCFAGMGIGGKMDLPALDKNFLGDVKTKDFHMFEGKCYKGNKCIKLNWDDNLYQLCIYALGNGFGPEMRLVNFYVSRTHDCVSVHEWSYEDKVRGFVMAKLLIELWYAINMPDKLEEIRGMLR